MKRRKGLLAVAIFLIVVLALMASTVWANSLTTVQVVNAEGLSGSTVDVPVHFNNAEGVCGGVIKLTYDPDAVVPVKVIQGDELPFAVEGDDDLEIIANLDYAPGEVIIVWAVNPRDGMPEAGLLCHVQFQIKKLVGSAVQVSSLELVDTEANETPSASEGGIISTGDLDEVVYGDVNGDGVINFVDAVIVLQNVLRLVDLAPNQLSSAMVNDGVTIKHNDAVFILQKAMKLIEHFPIEQK